MTVSNDGTNVRTAQKRRAQRHSGTKHKGELAKRKLLARAEPPAPATSSCASVSVALSQTSNPASAALDPTFESDFDLSLGQDFSISLSLSDQMAEYTSATCLTKMLIYAFLSNVVCRNLSGSRLRLCQGNRRSLVNPWYHRRLVRRCLIGTWNRR